MTYDREPKLGHTLRHVYAIGAAGFVLTACGAETDYCTEPLQLNQGAVEQSVTGKRIELNGLPVEIDYSTQAVLGKYPTRELAYLRIDDGTGAAEAWSFDVNGQLPTGTFEMKGFRVAKANADQIMFACD